MRLVFGTEQRLLRLPDGTIWSNGMGQYQYWTLYLQTFHRILMVARVNDQPEAPEGWSRVDGPEVNVCGLPHYIGPSQFLRHALEIRRIVRSVVRSEDAILLRSPGEIANALAPQIPGRPFAVEVVGDPWDAFSPGAIRHPLRPIFRRYFARQLQKHCRSASAIAYVTRETLQERYPGGPESRMFQVTDGVDEVSSTFTLPTAPSHARLVFVGSLAQLYKAPDVLLKALALIKKSHGLSLHLTMVGDGKHRPELEALAASLGIVDCVEFVGEVPSGDAVRAYLDSANLFVLPSRTEGLPRALLEAMARGLPAIGSAVGGFAELLPQRDLVEPGNVEALANAIHDSVCDSERMAQMSSQNLEVARNYINDDLQRNRRAFHQALQDQTMIWSQAQGSGRR